MTLQEEKGHIIPVGVCCAREPDNLYEWVICSIAYYEDEETSWPLPGEKWRSCKSRQLWVHVGQTFPKGPSRRLNALINVPGEYFNMAYFYHQGTVNFEEFFAYLMLIKWISVWNLTRGKNQDFIFPAAQNNQEFVLEQKLILRFSQSPPFIYHSPPFPSCCATTTKTSAFQTKNNRTKIMLWMNI